MNGPPAAVAPGSRHRDIICQTQTLAALGADATAQNIVLQCGPRAARASTSRIPVIARIGPDTLVGSSDEMLKSAM